MINSKNIYSNLNSVEITLLFHKQPFFIIQDSLNFIYDNDMKMQNSFVKLFTKFTTKAFLPINLFNFRNMKFPVYVFFTIELSKFQDLFLKLFSNFRIILLFKHKMQIFNLEKEKRKACLISPRNLAILKSLKEHGLSFTLLRSSSTIKFIESN